MSIVDQIAFATPTRIVNEQSTMVVSARFRNRAAAADATTPTNVKYQITDVPSGTILTDFTTVTPANPVSITLSTTQTKILNDTRGQEKKRLTIVADYGLATQFLDSMTFEVRNLSGIL